MTELNFFLRDIDATERFARAFAAAVENSAVVALNGPLGVGKTKFVQAFADELGVEELVNSPTFTMLNEYHSGRLPLFHFDLYRLSEGAGATAAAMLDLELEEILHGQHVILIEWAELLEKEQLADVNFLSSLDRLVANFSYADQSAEQSDEQCAEQSVPEVNHPSSANQEPINSSSLYTHAQGAPGVQGTSGARPAQDTPGATAVPSVQAELGAPDPSGASLVPGDSQARRVRLWSHGPKAERILDAISAAVPELLVAKD